MAKKNLPALPQSATDLNTSVLGFACAVVVLVLLHRLGTNLDAIEAAVLVLAAAAAPPVIADLFVFKRYREKSAGFGAVHKVDWRLFLRKCFGLAVTLLSFAGLYLLLPEYHSGFYRYYFAMLGLAMPAIVIITPLYFYWCARRDKNPHDGYDEVAQLAMLRFKGRDWAEIGRHYRNWLVKGFFLPLMMVYVVDQVNGVIGFNAPLDNFPAIYRLSDQFIMFADLLFASVGYILTFRILNAHIRSSDPTFRGWMVALVCYVPFWEGLFYERYFAYGGEHWDQWLNGTSSVVVWAWGAAILGLLAIYSLSTLCLGIRFSNLTYRGLITSGPYRFTKHPAYVTKNMSWWLTGVPFMHGAHWWQAVADCLLLGGVNLIYYLRARTEELHLSNYPEYVEYALAMNQRSVFRPLVKFLPFLEYKVPKRIPPI